ncbi:nucleolar pre-ribosomal-associated protein 1 [Trichonephila clavipes]|nr:nucleolar pre-ribosomal-associated protein 1 [Trichonephila clavipes]
MGYCTTDCEFSLVFNLSTVLFLDLKHLIDQAEEFDAKNSNYDVIKEYLLLSGNCQELLRLITEVSTWDSQNAMLLFNALSYILIRTAKDLDIYIPIGRSIANEILSYGMRTILNFLKCKQKSSRVKSALHLLTTMVALGGQIAHQVVAKLNFANTELFHLLGRTNFSGCGSPVVKVSNHGRHVMSSIPVPLKTRRVGQRCTLNLSRAETSSRWCGVVVRRGGCQLRCRPRHLTMVQNYVVRRQKPSCS